MPETTPKEASRPALFRVTTDIDTATAGDLKPRLLSALRPGTRVVSYRFDMGNWEPERTEKVGDREIYRWTIPEPGTVR